MFKTLFALLAFSLLIPCSSLSAQSRSLDSFGSGVHQYFSGRHQTAIYSFNNAIATDAKNARAYFFRGLAKMGSGDTYGAKSDFEMGAMVEAEFSKQRTSLVTRSLERVQGGLRLQIEKTRSRVFTGGARVDSTVVAPSIPVESFPVISSYPTGVVTYDSPVPSSVVSAPIVYEQPLVYRQPQIIYSQPMISTTFEQQVLPGISNQPQTVVYDSFGPAAGGQAIVPVPTEAIVIEPFPADPVSEFGEVTKTVVGDTPLEESETSEPVKTAKTATPEPEPTVQTVAAEEAAAIEEAVVVEEKSVGAASPEPGDDNTFGDATSATEEAEMPAEAESGSDPFGADASDAGAPEATDAPFGDAGEPEKTDDPFGAGAAEAADDPFGAGASDSAPSEDPFGTEAVDAPLGT